MKVSSIKNAFHTMVEGVQTRKAQKLDRLMRSNVLITEKNLVVTYWKSLTVPKEHSEITHRRTECEFMLQALTTRFLHINLKDNFGLK